MAKYKNIHIDIYKRDITVFIGSHSEFMEWIKNNEPSEKWENLIQLIINSDDSAEASFWRNTFNGNGIIELQSHPKSSSEIATAAHECLHAVMHILSFVGVSYIEGDSNEPYTYLLEYLLENILDYNDYKLINV